MLSRVTGEGYDTSSSITPMLRIMSDFDLERLERRVGKLVKERGLPEIMRVVRFEHEASHSDGIVVIEALRRIHVSKVAGSRDARIVSTRLEEVALPDENEKFLMCLRQ